MQTPRLPDVDNPRPEIADIGFEYGRTRENFTALLRDLTDVAVGTDTVFVQSEHLRQLAQLGSVLTGEHEQLEKSSKINPKSGVINFETARDMMDQTIDNRRRQVESMPGLYHIPFAYYSFFDVDNFKQINSVLTNPVADLTLSDMGKSLNRSMQKTRKGDFPMQHGGDEFGFWFADLFGHPADAAKTVQMQFERSAEILRALQADVNHDLVNQASNRGITQEQLDQVGEITFSLGFTYPSLEDIDAYKRDKQDALIPDSTVIFMMANEQEVNAKINKTTSTLAVGGVVYSINGERLN